MDVTEMLSEGLKREYKIVVPPSEIDERIGNRIEEIRRTVKMRGFRPGKVPASLVRKQYEKAILGEVLEETVNTTSQQALADQGVRPASQPKIEIENFAEGEGLSYKMAVEALPDIEPADLSNLKLTRYHAEVTDEAVEDALRKLAEQQRRFEPVEEPRPAREGDSVVIDFVGRVDGEPFEGGSAEGYNVEIGANRFVPGLEEQLIGLSPGEKKTIQITFPEDFPREDLAGKPAEFDVDVKELREPQAVEVDEELAKSFGLDSLEALRAAMRERIDREYAQASRFKLKRQLLDTLSETHHFEVPPGMVDQEFETIWRQLEEDMKARDSSFEDEGQSEEALREEYRRIAERRVRLGLLLSEIGRLNNVTVPQEEVNRAIMAQARRYPGQEKEIFNFYQNNPQAVFEIRAPLFEDKVVDYVIELADVEEKSVSPEELLREPDEEGAGAGAGTEKAAN